MPAPRKPGSSSLLDSLNERTRAKAPDNFASIQTYYRSAAITLRQVWGAPHYVRPLPAARRRARTRCRHLPTRPPRLPRCHAQADEYRRRDNDAELYVMLTRFIR